MLCIIVGHLGVAWVKPFVFSFHVPIFYLISGYFLKENQTVKEFAKQKARQLLLPYVITCICIILWGAGASILHTDSWQNAMDAVRTWLAASLYGSGTIERTEPFYMGQIGAIWFLPALFFGLLIVKFFVQYRHGYIGILVTAYVGYKTTDMIWLPLSIQAGMVAAFFIYIGYLARKHQLLEASPNPVILSGLTAIWFACVLFGGKVYLVRNYFENGILDVLGALAGSYLVIYVAKEIEKRAKWTTTALGYIGKYSLYILCCHGFDLCVLSWDGVWKFFREQMGLQSDSVTWILFGLRVLLYCGVAMILHMIRIFLGKQDIFGRLSKCRDKLFRSPRTVTAREREVYWDCAKGIAILLMILGHADVPVYLRRIIFSFHMPLFIIANGYFVKTYEVKRTFKRSVRTLLVPYMIVCMVSAFIYASSGANGSSPWELFAYKVKVMLLGLSKKSTIFQDVDGVWVVWFVCCLFLTRNLYVLLRKILASRSESVQSAVIIGLSAAGCLIGKRIAFLPWSMDVALASMVFMAFGDWMKKNKFLEWNSFYTLALPLAIWVFFLKAGINIELAMRSYPLGAFSFIEAIAGSVVVITLAKSMRSNSFIARIFSWMGKNSMIMLGVHCIEMMYFDWNEKILQHLPISMNWICVFLIKCIGILIVTALIDLVIKSCRILLRKHHKSGGIASAGNE